jgi:hypothetical protein
VWFRFVWRINLWPLNHWKTTVGTSWSLCMYACMCLCMKVCPCLIKTIVARFTPHLAQPEFCATWHRSTPLDPDLSQPNQYTSSHLIICYIPSKANCCGEKRNHLFNRTCCYAASSFRRLSRLQRPHNLDKDWPLSECSPIFSTEIVRFSCFIVMVTYTEQFLGLNVYKISCNITLVSSD